MLCLTREKGERIRIGADVWVTVLEIDGRGRVRLGISAPPDVLVMREELLPHDERHGERK